MNKAKEEIRILGLDMSCAFDMIDRRKLMSELERIVDEDCWRMIYILLEKTTLQARIKSLSNPFSTNIGAPQGNSLSPVLTIYLELAMRETRNTLPRPPGDEQIPNEIIYADDTDLISYSKQYTDVYEAEGERVLREWNLNVNADKTERTDIVRKPTKEEEEWRTIKKLGSLLGDTEEANRRKQLAAAAFSKLRNIWRQDHNRISTARLIRLYEAYVTPILTYNACTWALTKAEMQRLDALRRRHFRSILGIRYPNTITNEGLYRRCKARQLDTIIREARWKMLGHTLRMDDEIPAKLAMIKYFAPTERGFQGRPRTTLPVLLNKDLADTSKSQALRQLNIPKTLKELEELRQLEKRARDRKSRKQVVAVMQRTQEPQSATERARRERNAF